MEEQKKKTKKLACISAIALQGLPVLRPGDEITPAHAKALKSDYDKKHFK